MAHGARPRYLPVTGCCPVLIALFFSGLNERHAVCFDGASGEEAGVVDMQVNGVGLTLGAMASEHPTRSIPRPDDGRLEELMLWHGTDETHLPPAHTLQNLSRDTVAALAELREARQAIGQLRAAMGRAFRAADFRELRAILLEALGPPPQDDPGDPAD